MMTMNPEKPRHAVTWRRAVLVLLVVAALVAIVMVRQHSSGGTVIFTMVDAETGQPVPNAKALLVRQWTRLPVEKLRLGLSRFRRTPLRSEAGGVEVRGIPTERGLYWEVMFEAPGYFGASFLVDTQKFLILYSPALGGSGYNPRNQTIPRTNRVTISLAPNPDDAGSWKIISW